MKPLRPAQGWAAFHEDGDLIIWAVGWRRVDVISELVAEYGKPWRAIKARERLRVARVVISPQPLPSGAKT